MEDPRRTDPTDKLRVSVLVDRETWAEFQAQLIRDGVPTSEGPTRACRAYLDARGFEVAKAARRTSL